jgi:hypothetical protein
MAGPVSVIVMIRGDAGGRATQGQRTHGPSRSIIDCADHGQENTYHIIITVRDAITSTPPSVHPGACSSPGTSQAAASGRVTVARQRRHPAASASAEAGRPPTDPGTVSCQAPAAGARGKRHAISCRLPPVRSAVAECLSTPKHTKAHQSTPKHTTRLPPQQGDGASPMPASDRTAGASAPEKGVSDGEHA